MRVYIATSIANRDAAKFWRNVLQLSGHTVTSRWIDGEVDWRGGDTDYAAQMALQDIEDMRSAHAILLIEPETGGVGMWVEMGYAIAAEIPVLYFGGGNRGVFAHAPGVLRFQNGELLMEYMNKYEYTLPGTEPLRSMIGEEETLG